MQVKSSIYTTLANKYNIPHQVIELLHHPFKFANTII